MISVPYKDVVANIMSKTKDLKEEIMPGPGEDGDLAEGFGFATSGRDEGDQGPSFKIKLEERRLRDNTVELSIIKRQENWLDKTVKDNKD